MANLFFVHTPMQLFMAQQIINQEGLKNNVMVYDYASFNAYYQVSYDLITIPEMWGKRVLNPVRLGWNMTKEKKHLIRSIKNIRKKVKELVKFVEDENTESIFLGDIKNSGYCLLAHIFFDKGIKVCFFEEGFSHYIWDVKQQSLPVRIKSIIIDAFIYYPLFRGFYENKVQFEDHNLNVIPQTVRYSLIPYYHEPFDKLIHTTLLLSPTLKIFLEDERKEIMKVGDIKNLVLFVNEDIKHFCSDINSKMEERLLKECVFKAVQKETLFLIKFHPAESKERREKVKKYFENNKISYFVVSGDKNIPVEYYLQMYKFNTIFAYAMAVSFYNGYLFHYTPIVRLLDGLYQICKEIGIEGLVKLEGLIKRLDTVQEKLQKENKEHVG